MYSNVFKYNYCFFDFLFFDDVFDYFYYIYMVEYINSYVEYFGIKEYICFNIEVVRVKKVFGGWKIRIVKVDKYEVKDRYNYKDIFVKFVVIVIGYYVKLSMLYFDG